MYKRYQFQSRFQKESTDFEEKIRFKTRICKLEIPKSNATLQKRAQTTMKSQPRSSNTSLAAQVLQYPAVAFLLTTCVVPWMPMDSQRCTNPFGNQSQKNHLLAYSKQCNSYLMALWMLVGMLVGPSEGCSECWLDLAEGFGTLIG